MKKKTIPYFSLIIFGILFTLTLGVLFNFIYKGILRNAGIIEDGTDTTVFDKHYVMIVDGSYSEYWMDVYTSASEEAAESNAYIELKRCDVDSEYTMIDLMNQSIYSDVDGIILQYTGEDGLSDKITEATEKNIPVVTLLNDAPESGRISYVGINAYSLGQTYADMFTELMKDDTDADNVVFFLTDTDSGRNQEQIFTQARAGILSSFASKKNINVSSVEVPANGLFGASEEIRKNFSYSEECPDFVVCFDAATTDIVYQALTDYNLLSQVKVIGYYKSETILKAIEDEKIISTLMLDTDEMGRYAAEALDDFEKSGHSNAYYSVSARFVEKGDPWLAQD
jgi:ribose transport system substrate-binding protein